MAVRFVVLCLLGVFVSSVLGQKLSIKHRAGSPSAAADPSGDGSYEDLKQGRIVAAQSRKTITTVTTSVSSVAATCATTINTAACRRKRRSTFLGNDRKIRSAFMQNPVENAAASDDLDGSLDSSLLNREEDGDERSDKEGKLAYTVWWSTTSTYTVTSRVNNGKTVSVSYFCSVVGAAYPPICA